MAHRHTRKWYPRRVPKRWEFSKRLAAWAAILATLSVILSYILAFLGKDYAGEVTTTIFTACIGYLITYAGKSLGEKVSRNKYGLDENGQPIGEGEKEL